jgi:hypothetical protein
MKLIEEIADMWRKAETHYLETEEDNEKWKVKEFQEKQNLTEEEKQELYNICNSMGV